MVDTATTGHAVGGERVKSLQFAVHMFECPFRSMSVRESLIARENPLIWHEVFLLPAKLSQELLLMVTVTRKAGS